jgi:hypothetical protein
MKELIDELCKTEHGFKHIQKAGNKLLKDTTLDHFAIANGLITDPSYQGRMLGTFMLGVLSVENEQALEILRTIVSGDQNWRVQEMLAKAFDEFAGKTRYEKALPEIEGWLADSHPNVNRAVIEGLRIWTSRTYFRENPVVAISLISKHKFSESEYLRKSVGNALRDISRKFPELIRQETDNWDIRDPKIGFVLKLINKA